jgi:D-tyrosyl-tRNA(Tyr) deacylase
MRALLQRVSQAKVSVDGRVIASIDHGIVVLLGVSKEDNQENARWLAAKVANLRIFEDETGKLNLSLHDVGGSVLVVSQFTLYGDAKKGRRPSFTSAAPAEYAQPLVEFFGEQLRSTGLSVAKGAFGAHMLVEIHNDGPVTLLLEKV